jgi:hypothetical protein
MKTVEIRPTARVLDRSAQIRQPRPEPEPEPSTVSTTNRHRLAYVLSLVIVALMTVVSAAGLVLGAAGIYGDPRAAASITAATAGILVPGFIAHDLLNLALGVPILLAAAWLGRHGSFMGVLLWPGALFYVLYTYVTYLVGAPFGPLFIPHIALVVLAAYTTVIVVSSINRDEVRRKFAGRVPARAIAGVLIGLGLLTLGQDGLGVMTSALTGPSVEPVARHIWTADLAIEVPALLIAGVLLWRRAALGYLAAPGLLFQFGITPVVLAAILAVQPALTGSPMDGATTIGLLVFTAVAFVPISFLVRAATPLEVMK